MVAYSFKKRFAPPILAGTKRQTLRNDRRRHARVGEIMQLYTGMRTKQCCLIMAPRCDRVRGAHVVFEGGIGSCAGVFLTDIIDGVVEMMEPDPFARSDGFTDFDDMARFWWDEHRLREWRGFLIGWEFPA